MNTLTITFKTFSLILSALGLFVFGTLFGTIIGAKISSHEPKVVMEPLPKAWIAIDPNQTECWTLKGLEKTGYLNPGELNRQMYSVLEGQGKVDPLRGQTLHCKFIDKGEIKQDFYLYQTWYKWRRITR